MFFFGTLENGVHGLEPPPEDAFDPASYGIDWEDYDNDIIRNHHDTENLPHAVDTNPFRAHYPLHFSHVEVEEPNCPFTLQQLDALNDNLQQLPFWGFDDMNSRRLLWMHALDICERIMDPAWCKLNENSVYSFQEGERC